MVRVHAMKYQKKIKSYLDELVVAIQRLDASEIDRFIEILAAARDNHRNIFIFGNGGSGATASHFVCDFNKGASYQREKRFKMICLNDNMPTLLAYANDVSYNDVFVEQLTNFLEPEDVVIAISGSGNSENVLRAIRYANEHGATTVGLCGYNGGKLALEAKFKVHVNLNDMEKCEDIHMILDHLSSTILKDPAPSTK
jgi:D-sedoheptulose 7-phosphate isomerase